MAECINSQGKPKVRYLTYREAKKRIKELDYRGSEAYSCSQCGLWHIGRSIPPKLVKKKNGQVQYVLQTIFGPNKQQNKRDRAANNQHRTSKKKLGFK